MGLTEKNRPQWPRAAASAAIFRDGKVLLAQRSKPPLKGIWSLPGGHIEPGEKAIEAAHRELNEETGITADLKGLADVANVIMRRDDGALRILRDQCLLWHLAER
jgi:ADP-ribose pyrophosphatase YjhB (NUDIX family)